VTWFFAKMPQQEDCLAWSLSQYHSSTE